jgi:hypothetical protein
MDFRRIRLDDFLARLGDTRGDPAAHAVGFQGGADRVRGNFVFGSVAYEDVVPHRMRILIDCIAMAIGLHEPIVTLLHPVITE